jgi:uncharacterized protein YjbJ (UPF0337 family)
MGSGTGDKAEGKVDEPKGKAKETLGGATGDTDTEAEGKVDQAKGKGKEALGDVKNAGQKAKEGVKRAVS